MPKKGMARPDWTHTKPKNELPPIPEMDGKIKSGKEKAKPIVGGTSSPDLKVWH